MQAYWRDGVASLSINALCKQLIVSKPTLYREFGSEDGVHDAVLECYVAAVIEPTLALIAQPRPFSAVLCDLLDWIADAGRQPAGCLLTDMRTARDRLGPATSARVAATQHRVRAAYEGWVAAAQARGEAAATVPSLLAARHLDTQIMTMFLQMAAGEDVDLVRAQAELALAALLPPGVTLR